MKWTEFCRLVDAARLVCVANAVFKAEVTDGGDSITLTDFDSNYDHPDVVPWDYDAESLTIPRDLNLGAGDYSDPDAGEVEGYADGSFDVECAYGTLNVVLLSRAAPSLWDSERNSVCGILDASGAGWNTDSNIQVLVNAIEACSSPDVFRRMVEAAAAAEQDMTDDGGKEGSDG